MVVLRGWRGWFLSRQVTEANSIADAAAAHVAENCLLLSARRPQRGHVNSRRAKHEMALPYHDSSVCCVREFRYVRMNCNCGNQPARTHSITQRRSGRLVDLHCKDPKMMECPLSLLVPWCLFLL